MIYPSQDLAGSIDCDVVPVKPASKGILAKIFYVVFDQFPTPCAAGLTL